MFGKQCVERMNKVGMLIDVSHCGPQTAYDAITYSKKPIIMSHVGAKGVWNTKRMASDEMIQAVAAKGGVVGIEAAPHTTMSKTKMTHDLDSFMEHFEYVKNMVGIDHVGFGVDCLYGDHVGVHHAFAQALSIAATSKTGAEYEEVPYVKYLENPTESSWNIIRWLVKHNYSDEDIGKVIGGNAIHGGDIEAILGLSALNEFFLLQGTAQEFGIGVNGENLILHALLHHGNGDGLGAFNRDGFFGAFDEEQRCCNEYQHHCCNDKNFFVFLHFFFSSLK